MSKCGIITKLALKFYFYSDYFFFFFMKPKQNLKNTFKVTSNRTRGNSYKLNQGRFKFYVRDIILHWKGWQTWEQCVQHWVTIQLWGLETCGLGSAGSVVGFYDLTGCFQFKLLYDPIEKFFNIKRFFHSFFCVLLNPDYSVIVHKKILFCFL